MTRAAEPIAIRSRGDRVSFTVRPRSLVVAVAVALLLLIVACFLVSLALGKYTVAVSDVITALAGAGTEQVRLVVVDWRLPRALLAALFGAALGLNGAIFQSLTRNALGSPDVIGFNMGSYTGVLVVMLAGGSGFLLIASGAVVGGLITAFLVYLLAYKRGVQGFRLIIIGIALSAMLGSLNTWIIVKADVAFAMQAAVWGAAQLARRLTSAGSSIDLVTSALVGAALLSIADLIAQHALPGVSLPVGAVTVSIGGLYLVWLLARETKTR